MSYRASKAPGGWWRPAGLCPNRGVSMGAQDPFLGVPVQVGRPPRGAVDYRVAWAPDGESFRGAGDSDWNDHPTGTSMTIMGLVGWDDHKVKVRARFDTTPKADWSNVATAADQAASGQERTTRDNDIETSQSVRALGLTWTKFR